MLHPVLGRLARYLSACALVALSPLSVSASEAEKPAASLVELVPLSAVNPGGRAGAFGGTVGDWIVVGGGVDVTTGKADPVVRALKSRSASAWEPVVGFSAPAWAASAQLDGQRLVIVGGITAEGYSAAVTELRAEGGALVAKALPSLPHAVAGAGAAVIGQKLFVFGGLADARAAMLPNELWVLDLAVPGATWRALEPLPGPGRLLAAVTAQYDVLHIFGGRIAAGDQWQTTGETWVYRPQPLEGTVQRGWEKRTDLPQPVAGAVAVPSGQAHTFVVGGDPRPAVAQPFELAVPASALPIPLYHALTDAWAKTGQDSRLVTGAGVKLATGESAVFGGLAGESLTQLKPVRRTRDLAWIDYAMVAGYFILLGGIGWYFSRHQESSEEFSLGSRSVQWWAAGISMFATGASAISFMAVPALAFATNLVWVFPVIMNIAGFFVQAYVIFPMLRKLQLTSTYEYLEQRFNVPLRLIASMQQILFLSFGRAAVVLVLPAIAIATTTGLNVYFSVLLMGLLTTIYTTVGGFKAVIWTEVFQGALKFLAPIAMVVICIASLPGGLGQFIDIGQKYHKFDIALLTWDITVPALWIMLLNNFLQFTVQLAGDQPMIQRVFSAPAHEVRRVAAMNVICGIAIGIVVNVMGIAIFSYFHAHPERLDAGSQNDQIVPLFATQALPAGLAGIVIAAIFASAMATVASNMNSVATIFTEDFYKRWRPDAPDGSRLKVLKLSSYAVGIVGTLTAIVLAGRDIKSMFATWNVIMGLLGGGIVGVYSLGMLTTRANGTGAVCGALISVVVMVLVRLFTPIHWAFYMPLAIGVCMLSGYLISFVVPDDKRDLTGLTIFTPRREQAN
jgi:SSS family transporter